MLEPGAEFVAPLLRVWPGTPEPFGFAFGGQLTLNERRRSHPPSPTEGLSTGVEKSEWCLW
jgi:hypothetical protein